MAKIKIKSEYLKAKFGEIIDSGFTSIPDLLIKHSNRIPELHDQDFWFIVQILYSQDKVKGKKNGFIKDSDLPIASKGKTLYRIRQRLSSVKNNKGEQLIFIESVYFRGDKGQIVGNGTCYDFEAFFNYLLELEHQSVIMTYRTENPAGQNDLPENDSDTEDQPIDQNDVPADKMTDTINRLKDFNTFTDANLKYNIYLNDLRDHMNNDSESDIKLEGVRLQVKHKLFNTVLMLEFLRVCGLKDIIKLDIVE